MQQISSTQPAGLAEKAAKRTEKQALFHKIGEILLKQNLISFEEKERFDAVWEKQI